MKKTIIIITSIIIFGVVGLIILSNIKQQASIPVSTGQKSLLTSNESVYDFGTISMKNGLVTKDFTITNPSTEDILISTLITSCMCTKAYIINQNGKEKGPFGMPGMGYVPPANEIIKAGESLTVRAIYDPNAHGPAGVGFIDRFLTLTDSLGNELKLEIKATVTP